MDMSLPNPAQTEKVAIARVLIPPKDAEDVIRPRQHMVVRSFEEVPKDSLAAYGWEEGQSLYSL